MGQLESVTVSQATDLDAFLAGQAEAIRGLMKRSARDIIEIGERLAAVKAEAGHGRFLNWIAAEFAMSDDSALRFMRVARLAAEKPQIAEFGPSALYLLAAPSTPEAARTEVFDRLATGELLGYTAVRELVADHRARAYGDDEPDDTAELDAELQDLAASAEPDMIPDTKPDNPAIAPPLSSPMAVHFSSESPEWYTPRHVIDRVLRVLGTITLDPCSNSKTAPNVPALSHYTAEDDGLAQPWRGRVYMNPPYGRGIDPWIAKLCAAHADGSVIEAIALVPARTDTDWFRRLRDAAICFVDGRLRFSDAEAGAPFPSALAYLGPNRRGFIAAFWDLGDVWTRVEEATP